MRSNCSDHRAARRVSRLGAPRPFFLAAALAIFVGAAGCSPGVNWRGYQFQPVADDARRDKKHMFVYFRNWSDINCTRFEENVLKSPEVLTATRTYYCVALEYYWDKPTADRLGIAGPPGVALLDPEGRPLARLSGEISAPTLTAELKRAAKLEGEASPTSRP